MSKRRRFRTWLTAAALASALALVAAGCAEESPVAEDAGSAAALGVAETTTAAPPEPAETTTLPPAAAPETTTTMAHDDEMGHDDEMADDDEMGHDDEMAADDEMGHDEDAEHQEDDDAAFDREIEVVMTEFAFDPATISVSAGETVRFVLVNQGAVPHEFRLTTAHAAAEHIASGHEGHDDGGEEGGHGHDEVLLEVAAGATDHLVVTFPEDAEWDQVACLIPGHYEAGMLGDLEIS